MDKRDPFTGMASFIRAAENKSFSVAARKMGLSPSAVSKNVSRLEEGLGVKLFHRSPRAVTLTSEGDEYYRRCRDVLRTVEDARAVVVGNRPDSPGQLRIALPISFGQQVVAPQLPRWQAANPNTHLEIILSDRHVDVVRERFDLAVRFDRVPDSRLIAKQLPSQTFITAASPEYLLRCGAPQTIDELRGHNCLAYIDKQTNEPRRWSFRTNIGGKESSFKFNPQGNLSGDQGSLLLNVALAHGGIIHAPDYLIKESVASGHLVPLLASYESVGPLWWVVYPYSRYPSSRLRRFIEFLTDL